MILLLCGMAGACLNAFASLTPSTINVPHDYPTIQEAINAANPGDTIYVQSGIYDEHVVVDKPSLTIVGEDRVNTIITGKPEADVISLKANGAKIVDFTLTRGYAGIQISPWTHGHQVTSNIIMENDFGVRGHYDVYDLVVSNNTISSNTLVGIEVAFYNSDVTGNVISSNGRGEFVELSAGIEILEAVYDTTVYSNNNMFVNNVIENNFNGVLSVWYSEGNLFTRNTFKNNTNNVFAVDPTSMNNSTVEENYWSDYPGEDKNGDGFGDTPYWFDAQNKDRHPLMSPYKYWSNPLVGDINRNMKVDITDLAIAARAFGTSPSYLSWNPNADINKDNRIDIRDLVLIAKNFGKIYI